MNAVVSLSLSEIVLEVEAAPMEGVSSLPTVKLIVNVCVCARARVCVCVCVCMK